MTFRLVALAVLCASLAAAQFEPNWKGLDASRSGFELLTNASVGKIFAQEEAELVVSGLGYPEGPVWHEPSKSLLFVDPGLNSILQYTPSTNTTVALISNAAEGANGMAVDPLDPNIVHICLQKGRRLVKAHLNTSFTADNKYGDDLVEEATEYNGTRLNSPNDAAVFSGQGEGARKLNSTVLYEIFFTDPPYGWLNGLESEPTLDKFSELGYHGVYRLCVTEEGEENHLELLTPALKRPNGIAISHDGRTLYVIDSRAEGDGPGTRLYQFPIADNGTVSAPQSLDDVTDADLVISDADYAKYVAVNYDTEKDPGVFGHVIDGMVAAPSGMIFAGGPGGLYVIDPAAREVVGLMRLGGSSHAVNVGLGMEGEGRGYLFATTPNHIWRIKLDDGMMTPKGGDTTEEEAMLRQ
ncbi:unnamed protein product [Vitrella brassicaformis CCMP3155]|uniref:SMP-30/Gluconolactonase/LRE-like region domain-containing protein n=2 Tax=Vitrella brassicaformis TaxID=1169539 RepID=A0A0G4FTQ3_VITBC|nr:unnamed protein product [Vitrella brassicaformis CCMP3155]|eukprot:CEM18330.1 unnamed protein product [Vitrella brassicaformis CCMP3155]